MDEPFSALDFQTRLLLSEDIYTILKREKKSVIMVTHDLSEAISMCDKVVVMSKRPSVIKNVHEIHFKNKLTPIKNRIQPEFNGYYDMIWKELDNHEK